MRHSSASPQSVKLAARSCRSCHRRKVRCDRGAPCVNCSRHEIPCVYPAKETHLAPKTPTLYDIANSLERVELLLSRFVGSSGPTSEHVIDNGDAGGSTESLTRPHANSGVNNNKFGRVDLNHPYQRPYNSTWELLWNNGRGGRDAHDSSVEPSPQDDRPLGVSLRDDPKSTPSFLQGSTGVQHRTPSGPPNAGGLDRIADLLQFYPDTQLALSLWRVYVTSVDPVLKILHIPTVQSIVLATILDPRSVPSSTVALTFAIFYAATTALCHDTGHGSVNLPWEKPVLLERYRMCLDRLLTVTELMSRPELVAIQALAIYATSLRANEVGRAVWVLNGLSIRLGQSIGIHRNDASIHLSPFETEMRLRLWWHLCVLDSRAPEDQGFQPAVDVGNSGLRLPLNLNDDQFYPAMTSLPAASKGWTEMSFFLIQAESCQLVRPVTDAQGRQSTDSLDEIREKRKKIKDPEEYFLDKFGVSSRSQKHTDLPLLAIQHISTAYKKMLFVLQLREDIIIQKRNNAQENGNPGAFKLSFKLACDALESSYVLLKGRLASRFNWFFSIYIQWYALTYVLRCLCSSVPGLETERAWYLVEGLFPDESSFPGHPTGAHDELDHGYIWNCLDMLRRQALSLRQNAGLPVSTSAIEAQSFSNGDHSTLQPLQNAGAMPSISSTVITYNSTEASQEAAGDLIPGVFSSLGLSMLSDPFLSDWNAVINGCLNDSSFESQY